MNLSPAWRRHFRLIERLESDLPASSARAGRRARASSGRLTLRYRLYRHANPVHRHGCQSRQPDRDCGWRLPVRARRARREEDSRRRRRRHGNRRARHQRPDLALGYLTEPLRATTSTINQRLREGRRCRHTLQPDGGTGSTKACTSPSRTSGSSERCSSSSVWRRRRIQPVQQPGRRVAPLCGRVCIRLLGDRKRSRSSSHPGEIGTLQRALRRRQAISPSCGGALMLRLDKVIKPWKEAACAQRSHQSLRLLE